MNPNLVPDRSDASPDSSKGGGDGANYLRRLKTDAAETSSSNPASTTAAKAPPSAPANEWKERRKSPRLRCSGSAEFQAHSSDIHLWGTITDISLHGCYVEMANTFPIGTLVHLVLKSCGIRIQASGEVRTSYPALGMGIRFSDLAPQEQKELHRLLAALSGSSGFVSASPSEPGLPADSQPPADPKALLDAVTEFFRRESLLTRDEFAMIAKRVRHS